jgi:hypothetical protein
LCRAFKYSNNAFTSAAICDFEILLTKLVLVSYSSLSAGVST